MKYRVIKISDTYYPQYRKFFIWCDIKSGRYVRCAKSLTEAVEIAQEHKKAKEVKVDKEDTVVWKSWRSA